MNSDLPSVVPRSFPEGTVPLIALEGSAFDCGAQYVQIVRQKYPGFRDYLNPLADWNHLPKETEKLFEKHAPFLLDIVRGMLHADIPDAKVPPASGNPAAGTVEGAAGGQAAGEVAGEVGGGCTSFSVAPSLTLDGRPISGQTKDTVAQSAQLYIVLRMRIRSGPAILVLAYPGELLGYGLWSTGMTLFRNALYSSAGGESGLTMVQWGLLALSMSSIDEAAELAIRHGIKDAGNCLLSDPAGQSVSVEFNKGGVSLIPAEDGLSVHANHPLGKKTAPFLSIPHPAIRENSFYRQRRLRELLQAQRPRLTAQSALMALSDHSQYPAGICRHLFEDRPGWCTTAAVIAEPKKGLLHVTRGQPCSNWPITHTL